ncbi:MAG: type II toxin-antitoxin system VapC family toxin [Solirubrobacterales bacterium]|nr:type II toxin-antitoxin system VapC family toxin [Solirubrobacterales bacterium]
MRTALCDTSVIVKWFYDEPGVDTPAARQIVKASDDGLVELKVLDLTYYEAANTFGKLGGSGVAVAGLLEEIRNVCGEGLVMDRPRRATAAEIADTAGLSFYDASYVAVARQHNLTLITADKAMIKAGGVLPSTYVESLGVV